MNNIKNLASSTGNKIYFILLIRLSGSSWLMGFKHCFLEFFFFCIYFLCFSGIHILKSNTLWRKYMLREEIFKMCFFQRKTKQLITSLWGEKMDTEMPTGCKEVVQWVNKICQLFPLTVQHLFKSSYNHALQEHNI